MKYHGYSINNFRTSRGRNGNSFSRGRGGGGNFRSGGGSFNRKFTTAANSIPLGPRKMPGEINKGAEQYCCKDMKY